MSFSLYDDVPEVGTASDAVKIQVDSIEPSKQKADAEAKVTDTSSEWRNHKKNCSTLVLWL